MTTTSTTTSSVSAFAYAMAFWFRHEGGYSNKPKDPGGETKFGISKKSYPKENIPGMTRARAVFLLRRDYWLPNRCDKLPPLTARVVFDFAANSVAREVRKHLQHEVGAKPDGKIGARTLASVRAYVARQSDCELARAMIRRRVRRFTWRIQKGKSPIDFLGGWMLRCLDLNTAIHEEI